MASIVKTERGYRAMIYVGGQRESKSFRTKREADAWGAARETQLRKQEKLLPSEKVTLAEVFERYLREVVPGKKGARKETLRIGRFIHDELLPVNKPIAHVTPDDIGQWRNARAKQVKNGSVIREMNILSSILETARREWRLIGSNPCRDVRRPKTPEHRDVVIGWREIRAMLKAMNYRRCGRITEVRQAAAGTFLLALRTGMRAGEICGLTWDRVFDDYCLLPVTKTTSRRVAFSRSAVRVIEQMRGWDERLVFGIKSQSLDALFRKYRQRAGLSGFTFHDSRHTAATAIAQKIDVLDLCKTFGWSNPKQAMTYYNPTASAIAKRLNRK